MRRRLVLGVLAVAVAVAVVGTHAVQLGARSDQPGDDASLTEADAARIAIAERVEELQDGVAPLQDRRLLDGATVAVPVATTPDRVLRPDTVIPALTLLTVALLVVRRIDRRRTTD